MNIYPQAEKCNSEGQQNETLAEFSFADLPSNLQKDLTKAELCIGVRPWTVRILNGDGGTALFFSQCMFWSMRSKERPGGRFWLTKSGAYEQIGISRTAYDRSVKRLMKLNLISYTENIVHDRLYTLNWPLLIQFYENDKRAIGEIREKKFNKMAMHPSMQSPMHPSMQNPMHPKSTELEIPLRDYKETLSPANAVGENVAYALGDQGTTVSNPPTTIHPEEEAGAGDEVGNREQEAQQLQQDFPVKPDEKGAEISSFQNKKNERNEVDTLIREFYTAIGQPKILPGILKRGCQQIAELLKDGGYSLADVGVAIAYVKNGDKDAGGRLLDQRGTPIGSIGYVSYIIAKAVQQRAEAEERRAATEARHAREEAAQQEEEAERNRKALAMAEEWRKNRPAWMSDSFYARLLKQGTDQAQAAPTQPVPVMVTPTSTPVSDDITSTTTEEACLNERRRLLREQAVRCVRREAWVDSGKGSWEDFERQFPVPSSPPSPPRLQPFLSRPLSARYGFPVSAGEVAAQLLRKFGLTQVAA